MKTATECKRNSRKAERYDVEAKTKSLQRKKENPIDTLMRELVRLPRNNIFTTVAENTAHDFEEYASVLRTERTITRAHPVLPAVCFPPSEDVLLLVLLNLTSRPQQLRADSVHFSPYRMEWMQGAHEVDLAVAGRNRFLPASDEKGAEPIVFRLDLEKCDLNRTLLNEGRYVFSVALNINGKWISYTAPFFSRPLFGVTK
jgi:hypothetical protein